MYTMLVSYYVPDGKGMLLKNTLRIQNCASLWVAVEGYEDYNSGDGGELVAIDENHEGLSVHVWPDKDDIESIDISLEACKVGVEKP